MTFNLVSLIRSVGEHTTESSKKENIKHFRLLDKICVIIEDKEIMVVKNQSRSIEETIRNANSMGFIEVLAYEDGEKSRFISISKVTEFTLGELPGDSPEFLTLLERYSNYARNLLGMNSNSSTGGSMSNGNSFN